MKIMQCLNTSCGRPFQLNQFSSKFSVPAQQGEITCPHCAVLSAGDSESIFLTHALTEKEEVQYKMQKPDKNDA